MVVNNRAMMARRVHAKIIKTAMVRKLRWNQRRSSRWDSEGLRLSTGATSRENKFTKRNLYGVMEKEVKL